MNKCTKKRQHVKRNMAANEILINSQESKSAINRYSHSLELVSHFCHSCTYSINRAIQYSCTRRTYD